MVETGRSEPYRVQVPSTVNNALIKLANIESRSVPNLMRDLIIEALARRRADEIVLMIKEELIRNGDKGQLAKTGTR